MSGETVPLLQDFNQSSYFIRDAAESSDPSGISGIVISDISLTGLQKPWWLLRPRCYATVSIGEETKSTEELIKDTSVKWLRQLHFDTVVASSIEIRIYEKTIFGGTFLGAVEEDILKLMEAQSTQDASFQLGNFSKNCFRRSKSRIAFRIQSSGQLNDLLQVGDAVRQLDRELPKLDAAPDAVGKVQMVIASVSKGKEVVDYTAGVWKPLLDTLGQFVGTVDKLAEVHPCVKAAWSVLSAGRHIIEAQIERDGKMNQLAEDMHDLYSFLCRADQVKKIEAQKEVLIVMAKQTEECLYFIQQYATDKHFFKRLWENLSSSVDDQIQSFQEKFKDLRSTFQGEATLQTEILVMRIADITEHTAQAIDLDDMLYADGVRYSIKSGCLLGTRELILDNIYHLLKDTRNDSSRIVLLTGVAGSGKSAIASTVAKHFDMRSRLGSSFFFNRSEDGGNKARKIFSTVARDLAGLDPKIKETLWKRVKDNPSLRKTHSILEQFEEFVLHPTKGLTIVGPIVIVMDALDECEEPAARKELLDALASKASALPSNLRVFLTARPESDIVQKLSALDFVHHLQMEDIDGESTTNDISSFIREQLSDIADVSFAEEWPEEKWLLDLVDRADKLFVWAATACRFIRAEKGLGVDPADQLKLILSDTPTAETSNLIDDLYLKILRSKLNEANTSAMDRFKLVMGTILAMKVPLSANTMMELFGSNEQIPRAVRSVVPHLGSLISGTTDWSDPLQTLHLSFNDFLTSPDRSQAFFIDLKIHSYQSAISILHFLNRNLQYDICGFGDPFLQTPPLDDIQDRLKNFEALHYACQFWVDGLLLTEQGLASEQVFEFLSNHLLHWLEVLSLIRKLDVAFHCLDRLSYYLKTNTPEHNLALDGRRLLMAFGTLISIYPLQVYHSALAFVPSQTRLSRVYGGQNVSIYAVSNTKRTWPPLISTLSGHTNRVKAIAFSPDGARIASGSLDKTVRLWYAATGTSIGRPLEGHTSTVNSVTFSPGGDLLASAANDKTIRLWDGVTGSPDGDPLIRHTNGVTSIEFSSDGRRLVSGSLDGTVILWDIATRSATAEPFIKHNDEVVSARFAQGGQQIVSCSHDGTVIIRKIDSETATKLIGHQGWVVSLSSSSDGCRLASGSHDKTVRLWIKHTGARDLVGTTLSGHNRGVTTVVFSPDNSRLASGSYDQTIRIWDGTDGSATAGPLEGHTRGVAAVLFSPDSTRLASCSYDRTIRLWDAHTGHAIGEPMTGHSSAVTSIAFSSDGRRLVSCSFDRTAKLWDMDIESKPMEGHADKITAVAFSPDGTTLASCSYDKTVMLWDTKTGRAIGKPMMGHENSVMCLAFFPDSRKLVSGSYDTTLRLWDLTTGHPIGRSMRGHTRNVMSITVSHDGTRIASGSRDLTIRLWDGITGHAVGKVMHGHLDSIICLSFSPDGNCLASGSLDNTVRLWDPILGRAIGEALDGHSQRVRFVTFSSDSKLLRSHSESETLLWDVHTRLAVDSHVSEPQLIPAHLAVQIDQDGWLSMNDKRILWIPFEYRPFEMNPLEYRGSSLHAATLDNESIIGIGGEDGTIIYVRVPLECALS